MSNKRQPSRKPYVRKDGTVGNPTILKHAVTFGNDHVTTTITNLSQFCHDMELPEKQMQRVIQSGVKCKQYAGWFLVRADSDGGPPIPEEEVDILAITQPDGTIITHTKARKTTDE